ncbi:MAG: CopG family transcriptional regulator [Deltaproteobacteria bacterium]|nr:MAG: CopG family transcriptional regulator [Deltaproteobacteria bacterium]
MATAKIAITIEEDILTRLDLLVKSRVFPNRSKAIQDAVREKLNRIEKNRLEVECAKLNPQLEQALADEGMSVEIDEWPKY